MFHKVSSHFVMIVFAAAATAVTPNLGWAQHGGGFGEGHFGGGFGGGYFGGGHYAGFGGARIGSGLGAGFHGGHYAGVPFATSHFYNLHDRYDHGYYGYDHSPYIHDRARYYRPTDGLYRDRPYWYGHSYPYYYNYGDPYYDSYGYPYDYNEYPYGYEDYPYSWSGPSYGSGFYDPASVEQPDVSGRTDDDRAYITVSAPTDAELWFDGVPTHSNGAARKFDSPPLMPDRRYTYHVRARWNQNGEEMTQTEDVVVTAGSRVNIKFPAPLKMAQKSSEALMRSPTIASTTEGATTESTGAQQASSEQNSER